MANKLLSWHEMVKAVLVIFEKEVLLQSETQPPDELPKMQYDLFGHYTASNVTFKPKDRVKINTPGPFDGLIAHVVSFEGSDRYLVSIAPKDKPSISLTFHRSELIPAEKA